VDANWKAVAAGRYHTIALRTDDTLWAWGSNFSGELGNGSDRNAHTNRPTRVDGNATWKSISAGFYHSVAIRSDGTLWTWGENFFGQLGLGLPTGYSDGNWTNRPVQVGTDANWQSVAAGERHSLAIRNDGMIWAWGDRSLGQTALPVPWLPHPLPGTDWWVP
jgi:alpha-tubulin suppressor-like RCC1 family protein